MANAQKASVEARYPKRKRVQVTYYEKDIGFPYYEEDVDFPCTDESHDIVEYSAPKKRKATSSKPLPKRKLFPFLELPAEIRNMIYGHCLSDPAGIYLRSTTFKYRRTVRRVAENELRGPHPYQHSNDDASDSDGSENEHDTAQKKASDETRPLVPALLAVCKQIHMEARDVLYSHEFFVHDTHTLHSFLVDLGPRAATYLKKVTLGEWGRGRGVHKAYNHAAFTALAAATNLEKFTFHDLLSWRRNAIAGATSFYRDAFPWLEAVGASSGRPDAGVDLIHIQVTETIHHHRYYNYKHSVPTSTTKPYDDMAGFRKELGRLLNARMDMIRS